MVFPELPVLPDDMRLEDTLGEFAEEQGSREQEAYEKLGLDKNAAQKNRVREGGKLRGKANGESLDFLFGLGIEKTYGRS